MHREQLTQLTVTSCHSELLRKRTAAHGQSDHGAHGVTEIYGEPALAHFPVTQVHATLSEVLLDP